MRKPASRLDQLCRFMAFGLILVAIIVSGIRHQARKLLERPA